MITVHLHGCVARSMILEIAERYARLTVHSRLPKMMWNHPRGSQDFVKWMAGVDSRRADYRRTLGSLGVELPEIPLIEYPRGMSHNGKKYPSYLSGETIRVAQEFSAAILERLDL